MLGFRTIKTQPERHNNNRLLIAISYGVIIVNHRQFLTLFISGEVQLVFNSPIAFGILIEKEGSRKGSREKKKKKKTP